jgi:hypothetical protein
MLELEETNLDRGGRLGRFIRNLEYLYKWLLLGIARSVSTARPQKTNAYTQGVRRPS